MARPSNLTISTSNRPTSSRSFALASPSSSSRPSSSGNEDDAPLPFPTALPRTDFLTPDFHAANYLASLRHRHQTLEDLRTDLRDRSTAISVELLELVNSNYASFLSLGNELKGGEERVEDVRVALLGFRRAVEDVRARVRDRSVEVSTLTEDLNAVRRKIETARKMLELDERISLLEGRLALASGTPDNKESADEEDDDDDDDEDAPDDLVVSSYAKLAKLVGNYVVIDELAAEIGNDTAFVQKMKEKMMRCRNTLLLDLNVTLKEAKRTAVPGESKVFNLLGLYTMLDAQAEAVKTLKNK